MCTHIRKNYYAIYLKSNIVIKLLNMASVQLHHKCKHIMKGTTLHMLEL